MDTEDKEASEKLFNLYHASLFDEDFQQAIIADIKQLPDEKIALLNENAQSFLKDEKLPDKLTDNRITPINVYHKKQLLERLLALVKGIFSFSISLPAITIPTSLVFGVLLGVNFLSTPMEEDAPTVRGDGAPTIPTTEIQTNTTQNEVLEHIASLILDGKIEEAEQQIKKFKQDYPDFKPSTE